MTLSNKYRPKIFEDFIGQEINVRFMASLVKSGQKAKNLIFYGPFGSSKTTSLRVFARALNCLQPTLSGSPCNACINCVSFLDKTFSDYIEVDAATAGDKDSLKALRDIAILNPMNGKYRIFALDEVQQISKAGWDVLLTLLEETPATTCFLFSTTEFEKIPEAIRSRCFGLEVKLLQDSQAIELLKKVCLGESLKYEVQALDLISYISKGHPRDLIKNLEYISCFGDVNIQNAKGICNFADWEKIQDLVNLLILELKPNFHNLLKSWQAPVSEMHSLLTLFFLHMKYSMVMGLEVDLHPVIKVISPSFYFLIKDRLKSVGGDFEKSLNALLKALETPLICNEISFHLYLQNLHTFIHGHRLQVNSLDTTPSAVPEVSTPVKKELVAGRRFLGNYADPKSIIPSEPEVVVKKTEEKSLQLETTSDKVVDKLGVQDLLKQGFTLTSKNQMNLQEILE